MSPDVKKALGYSNEDTNATADILQKIVGLTLEGIDSTLEDVLDVGALSH